MPTTSSNSFWFGHSPEFLTRSARRGNQNNCGDSTFGFHERNCCFILRLLARLLRMRRSKKHGAHGEKTMDKGFRAVLLPMGNTLWSFNAICVHPRQTRHQTERVLYARYILGSSRESPRKIPVDRKMNPRILAINRGTKTAPVQGKSFMAGT